MDDILNPTEYQQTLSGEQFLVKVSSVGDNKIMIFTTCFNLKKLESAQFWIMDGTFKTVPTVFKQMYTIHAPIGPHDRSRVLPIVYVLMSRKNAECYIQLFRDLQDYAAENETNLSPQMIITDYEISVINAVKSEMPGTANKGCFFSFGTKYL